MKLLLALSTLLGISLSRPQFNKYNRFNSIRPQPTGPTGPQNVVPILQYSNDVQYDGNFQYSYQTGDGINAQAVGSVHPATQKDAESPVASKIEGSYSYVAPDGQQITVNYIADENGYHATGTHLPTPPPIPAEIARSLEFIQAAQRNNPPLTPFSQKSNRYG